MKNVSYLKSNKAMLITISDKNVSYNLKPQLHQ